jgi:D-alanyl-D-alanine carboxypeptidase
MKKLKCLALIITIFFVGCNQSEEVNIETTNPLVSITPPPNIETDSSVFTTEQHIQIAQALDHNVDNEWALWLINALNPLPIGYVPDLTSIGSYNGDNREFDSRAAPYAIQMINAASNDGISLEIVSSYRRIARQEENFRGQFNNLVNQGYSREKAFEMTASEYAIPVTSEHNAGLAIDFNLTGSPHTLIEESFDQTSAFQWLGENAHKYGFVLRYPKNTMHITGIVYEPWHADRIL